MTSIDDGMRRAVMRRLAMLDQATEHSDAGSLVPLARAELQRLADGWRLLLEVHTADEDGRCRACPGRLRKRRWPCKVWLLAHQHLIGEGNQTSGRSGGVRNPFRRRGRHSKPTGVTAQGMRTPRLAEEIREIPPPELLAEVTAEIPVLPPPPAIASSGPLVAIPIVDDPTWPAGGVVPDLPAVPALASLDPIGAFGGVLPTEQDAETEEMRRVLEAYWGESPAAT
jgi:hypothetical protein